MKKIRKSQSLLVSSIMLLLIITSMLPQGNILPQAACAPDTFGNTTPGTAGDYILDCIRGSVFTSPGAPSDRFVAESMTAYIAMNQYSKKMKAAIYDAVTGALVGATEEVQVPCIDGCAYIPQWVTFNFPDPKPILEGGGKMYILVAWSESLGAGTGSADLYYTVPGHTTTTVWLYRSYSGTGGVFPDPAGAPAGSNSVKQQCIYATINKISPTITIESGQIKDQTLEAAVCSNFAVEIWIRGIPEGFSLSSFDFNVNWDPTLMEIVGSPLNYAQMRGWTNTLVRNDAAGTLSLDASDPSTPSWGDDVWLRITFHCLGEGSSPISVFSPEGTVTLVDESQVEYNFYPEYTITCNQRIVSISPRSSIVGGFYTPVSSFEVLLPYFALVSLLGVIVTILIAKKTRNRA